MKDEEIAEEYKESKRHKCFRTDVGKIQIEYEAYLNNLKQAFLAGLKAGRPQWHDLRKNPNDLPKECKCKGKLYLVNIYSDSQLKFEYAEYTPTVCLWNSEWKRFEILEHTVGSIIVNIKNVIAWKEIVLLELKESE